MEVIYYFAGVLTGGGLSYFWFLVGRNTGYQDKNILTPPAPVSIPIPSIVPKEKANPVGWVDDFSDPSLGDFRKEAQL